MGKRRREQREEFERLQRRKKKKLQTREERMRELNNPAKSLRNPLESGRKKEKKDEFINLVYFCLFYRHLFQPVL